MTCPPHASTRPERSSCAHFDLGEADRIVTLLTPEDGKVRAIAKGVRRQRSRIGGSVEPFAELDVVARPWPNPRRHHPGRGPARVAARCATASSRRRPPGTSASSPTARSRSAPARTRSTRCCGAPASCSTTAWRPAASRAGSSRGWPTRSACGRRSSAASSATACWRKDERFRWVPALGGVLCQDHPAPPTERVRLSLDALKLLRAYRRLDIEAIAALRLPAEAEAEVEVRPAPVHASHPRARGSLAGVPRRGATGADRRPVAHGAARSGIMAPTRGVRWPTPAAGSIGGVRDPCERHASRC